MVENEITEAVKPQLESMYVNFLGGSLRIAPVEVYINKVTRRSKEANARVWLDWDIIVSESCSTGYNLHCDVSDFLAMIEAVSNNPKALELLRELAKQSEESNTLAECITGAENENQ